MSEQIDVFEDVSNPLDNVEEIMSSHDWVFDRMNEDELTVEISGKMGHYQMHFVWQEEYSAMQFRCECDMSFHENQLDLAAKALSAINSNLWLGHFDIREDNSAPCFRHTSLFRGMIYTSNAEHIEDLVDIALMECERFYPAFNLLATSQEQDIQKLTLALMETTGES